MNVLSDIAEWKKDSELPSEDGIYFVYSKKNASLNLCSFDGKNKCWTDGIYTPQKPFDWLNVRVDVKSGMSKQTQQNTPSLRF